MWWSIIAIIIVVVLAVIIGVVIIAFLIVKAFSNIDDNPSNTRLRQETYERLLTPSNDLAGLEGERQVNYSLRTLLKEDEYLLTNVLLPLKNGFKTEIDCVLISRKGIFCIETKNWVGHIHGNDEDDYWVQKYDDLNMTDRRHENPVKQNERHCATLKRRLNNKYPIDNVVIFVELDGDNGIDSDYAFTIRQFKNYYRDLNDDEINANELKIIHQQLASFVASKEELKKHREDVIKRRDK